MSVLGVLAFTIEVPDLRPGMRFYTDAGLTASREGEVTRFRCTGQTRESIALLGGYASGSGFVIGVGRVGSAIAPSVAGWLFAVGIGRAGVRAAFGVSALVAGLVLASRTPSAGPATLSVNV